MSTWACLWVLAHLISHDLWPEDGPQAAGTGGSAGIPAFSATTAWYVRNIMLGNRSSRIYHSCAKISDDVRFLLSFL